MPGMTDRDHFAAAALASLLNTHAVYHKDPPALATMSYSMADAMLRERARTNLDAAPAARAPEPEPEPAARRRPAGGTGGTDHGASPEARASVGRPRTDNADLPICAGTGDTPDSPQPIKGGVSDRSKPINGPDPDSRVWETPVHTPAPHATPGEGSVPREGTDPVAWGVAGLGRILATSISCADAVDMQSDHLCDTEVVPLYRSPTLTDVEREAISHALRDAEQDAALFEHGGDAARAATLRGLLERIGGGR